MRLTQEKLKQIIKEELAAVQQEMNLGQEYGNDPKQVAKEMLQSMERPTKADQKEDPGMYHAYYLIKQFSLTGDLDKAKSYYQAMQQNREMVPHLSRFQEKLANFRRFLT